MSIRTEKIASTIKKTLTHYISDLAMENKLGLASISTIKLSKDISVANIFVNLFASKSNSNNINITQFLELLNNNKGKLRSIVAKEIQMRSTPELRFFYDDTLEQMQQIENLLDNVKKKYPYKEDYGDESVYKETTK